nr:MAG TPA: hypothetical protein [Caudoviricetes sp.]
MFPAVVPVFTVPLKSTRYNPAFFKVSAPLAGFGDMDTPVSTVDAEYTTAPFANTVCVAPFDILTLDFWYLLLQFGIFYSLSEILSLKKQDRWHHATCPHIVKCTRYSVRLISHLAAASVTCSAAERIYSA